MGMTGNVGTVMNDMQQVLQHMISLPGEDLPENPRTKAPLPDQPNFGGAAWQQHKYHTSLGSYTCLFVDDILCFSRTEEDHVRHLRQVCATLEQHHLYLNFDKIEICQPEITYLGNRVGRYGIRPTADRAQAALGWPEPENTTELKSFLGLLGFLRRYIADMAQIAAPLNRLLKKETPWDWGDEQQQAFDKLKRRCSSTPVLAIPSHDAELVLRCDASREAMGVALYQRDEHGFLQPIEFKSKAFNEAQKRLAAHDREGLALLYALKSFRHFLLIRKFEVQTDNSALSQIFTSKDLSDLYARWYHKLTEFQGMSIKHRAGRKLYCADALSRRRQVKGDFCVEPGVLYALTGDQEMNAGKLHANTYIHTQARDNAHTHASPRNAHTHTQTRIGHEYARARKHIPENGGASDEATPFNTRSGWSWELLHEPGHKFVIKVVNAESEESMQDPQHVCGAAGAYNCQQLESASLQQWRGKWPALYKTDPDFAEILEEHGNEKWGYFQHHGLLWKMGASGARLCLPKGADKVQVLKEMHDSKTAGHQGVRRTLAKVMGSFYWTGMYGDVVKYVETCHRCQISKIDRRARMGEPRALPIPEAPWDMVHMDWITGFPESPEGFNAILVFICALTGMVHLQACKKTDTAKDTAKHFVKNVVRLHGMPISIVSD
jgi:hypothetical protein